MRSSAAGLIDLIGQDKKVHSGAMTFVLLRGIGQAFITQDVDLGLLAEVLEEALEPQGA